MVVLIILDPWDYLLKDKEGEVKFEVNLEDALKRAANTRLLLDYNILVTANVKPVREEMKGRSDSMLMCSG